MRPVGRNCTFSFGTLGSLNVTRSGSWAASDRCIASLRGDSQTPYYAKRYEFTLDVHADVTIDLSSSQDAYLYLLEGHGTSASYRARNDDADSTTHDSRLTLGLDAGKYTIDATTFSARSEGSFTLTVATDIVEAAPVTVTGLAGSYNATVGEALDLSISVTPVTAVPSVQSVTPTGLNLELTRNLGTVSISGTPTHAGTYSATFAFVQPGRTDTHSTVINVACPQDHTQNGDRSCTAPAQPVTVERLAQRYEATVGELFSASFNYEPDAAQVSVQSVAPSGLSLTLADRSGSAGMAGTPKLAGKYKVTLAFAQPGRTYTEEFTVDASCARDHVQQGDRSCEPCTTSLGTVGSGTLGSKTGSWGEGCVLPAGRMGRAGTFHARHYTFTLSAEAAVAVDLESDDQDTYLFLLEGHGPDGTLVDYDDNGGTGRNSRLVNHRLKAGDYTITASTFNREVTGEFRVAALGVSGLKSHYRAYAGVDASFTASFQYRPRAAAPRVASVTPSGLTLTLADLSGNVGISGTPSRIGTYSVTLEFAQGTQTHTRTFTVTAGCSPNSEPHIDGSGACTPTRLVPPGCRVASLDRAGRDWWGHVSAEADYSAYGSGARSACRSLSGSGKAVYYSFTVPAFAASGNPPDNQRARVSLKPRPKRVSRPPYSSPGTPLLDGGQPIVALWRRAQGGRPVSRQVGLVKSETAAAATDPSLNAVLPAGRYIIEIAPTTANIKQGGFNLGVWIPAPEKVHTDVKQLGNTGLNGAGLTLEGFLDARGSVCYGAHPTCPTDADDPFDPLSPSYPWLPFITDKCSIPQGLVKGIEAWINAMIQAHSPAFTTPQLVDLAQYIRDHAKFSDQTVSFVFACMRHDFNWRNLYRVEHHLQHGDAWNSTARAQADEQFNLDLKRLCDANLGLAPVIDKRYEWKLEKDDQDKCKEVADAMRFGVQTYPMSLITYGSDEVS